MRTILLLAIAGFAMLSPAIAGRAIYKTTGNETIYGNGKITRIAAAGFWVFDPATGRITGIGGFTVNGQKLFSVVAAQKWQIDHVDGPAGSTYTILAKAESPGTQFAGTLLESVYARGLDSVVTIDATGPQRLPRTFATAGRAIVQNTQTGVVASGETTGTATLDINASRATNLSETFDDAVTRLTLYFIARGYTQFTAAPAAP